MRVLFPRVALRAFPAVIREIIGSEEPGSDTGNSRRVDSRIACSSFLIWQRFSASHTWLYVWMDAAYDDFTVSVGKNWEARRNRKG